MNRHIEVYGSKLDNIAETLKLTIPRSGILVTAEKKYFSILKKRAGKLRTKIIQVETQNILARLLKKFKYINFSENLAIALKVTRLLAVKEEVAIQGMLKAAPDPGVAKIYRFSRESKPASKSTARNLKGLKVSRDKVQNLKYEHKN